MAQSFSPKKYFSKLYAHQLLSELAEAHATHMFFEINDQTPRKLAISLMQDSLKALDTEKRMAILKDLSYVASMTSAHTALLGKIIFKEETGKEFEPDVECVSDHDVVLYFFLRHKDIAEKLAFLFPFYATKSYVSYEAKPVTKVESEIKLTELTREFERLANKDDNATVHEMEYLYLDDILYVESKFQGSFDITEKLDATTGEIDKRNVTRRIQTVRIAYLPKESVMLLSGTMGKEEKLTYIDTFLRVVCSDGYVGKVESYDLQPLKNLSLDFTQFNKGTPFIKASIGSVSISYAEGKKKIRLTLPQSRDQTGLQALKETLEELGLEERFGSFDVQNMTFKFLFQNISNPEKSVSVSCSISPTKASLCPLFEYERYTKSILKNAGIYEGWKMVEEK